MRSIVLFGSECSTLHSIETPYPILALVGPLGSANKELAMKLAEDFHEFFAYGAHL